MNATMRIRRYQTYYANEIKRISQAFLTDFAASRTTEFSNLESRSLSLGRNPFILMGNLEKKIGGQKPENLSHWLIAVLFLLF